MTVRINYSAWDYGDIKKFVDEISSRFGFEKDHENIIVQDGKPVFYINNGEVVFYKYDSVGQNRKLFFAFDKEGNAYNISASEGDLYAEFETDFESAVEMMRAKYPYYTDKEDAMKIASVFVSKDKAIIEF
jgi:hypothetical protein